MNIIDPFSLPFAHQSLRDLRNPKYIYFHHFHTFQIAKENLSLVCVKTFIKINDLITLHKNENSIIRFQILPKSTLISKFHDIYLEKRNKESRSVSQNK